MYELKTYKPRTPALRFYNSIRLKYKFRQKLIKKLIKQNKLQIREIKIPLVPTRLEGIVINIEYNPHQTAYLSLVYERNLKSFFYFPHLDSLMVGHEISNDLNSFALGTIKQLKDIEFGLPISNLMMIENGFLVPKQIRAAGTYGRIVQRKGEYLLIKLPSKKFQYYHENTFAMLGTNGNRIHGLRVFGKAGISRHRGIRPKVRGVAMNPIDHPHGGGEGKTGSGRPKVSPWGKVQGRKTRKKKKKSNKFLVTQL